LPVAEKDLLSIFEAAKNGVGISETIIEVTGWDKANVEFFVNKLPATAFLNEISLIILQKQIELSRLIGVSIEKLESWANDSVTDEQARHIKRSLKTKYDESAWVEVSTQVHNRIRNHLRDALVAYLLQKSEIKAVGLKDANDLYGYFLIDVEMDACMLTSRLKQAIASVQLFVQRCLLNLESHKINSENVIPPNLINAKQWQWMKNYRVWEANRKVFLYPENWIEPELRDDKSPFFKELESELLQGEVTNESVEKALMNYLEKLHDVARLDICGIWQDNELHVFGRTFNTPAQYYYRKLDQKTQVWTAWEKVQLDIQGNEEGELAGVHLIPVVWNRRLYLFWPIFTKKAEEGSDKTYEVKIAWGEYRQNKWSNKKTSQSSINTVGWTPRIRFSIILDSTLIIKLFLGGDGATDDSINQYLIGEYRLNCNGKVLVFLNNSSKPVIQHVINYKQINFYQGFSPAVPAIDPGFFSNNSKQESFNLTLRDGKNEKEILTTSVQEYKVLFPADHNYANNSASNFFYQDYERNYFVKNTSSAVDWYNWGVWSTILVDMDKVPMPSVIFNTEATPIKLNISDASLLGVSNRLDSIQTNTLNQIVENRQLSTSTDLQLSSMQMEKVSKITKVRPVYVPYQVTKTFQNYFFWFFLPTPNLQFKPFFHAYVCKFMEALDKGGVDGLLNLDNQKYRDIEITKTSGGIAGQPIPTGFTTNFLKFYGPNENNVAKPYPLEDVDFSFDGACSLYNWELFFQVPMLLANRLSKNQHFEEAMRWYHFVFNPTTNENGNSSVRYWQVIPLREPLKETLKQLFDKLKPDSDPSKRKEFEDAIAAWRNDPFKPHLIARMRLCAYQKNVVMKYLDNLIAWADNLFQRDTIESINEATQLYILAAEILGKHPEKIPARGNIKATTYAEVQNNLNAFSNPLVRFETIVPFFNLQAVQSAKLVEASTVNTAVSDFYFCLPENDKLLGYWDTVADRLFKIRHCQNIGGIERQLALFEPPIDPALLVQAVAGGVDISSVLADLNSPLPYYRFNYILQKAMEICVV
jgi:Neuraminidase-like domain